MLPKETGKDRVLAATVVRYTREGWPLGKVCKESNSTGDTAYTVEAFKKIRDSLSVSNGCLLRSSCGDTSQPATKSVGDSAPRSFRHAAYETLSKNGSLLAGDRLLYCGSQLGMSTFC